MGFYSAESLPEDIYPSYINVTFQFPRLDSFEVVKSSVIIRHFKSISTERGNPHTSQLHPMEAHSCHFILLVFILERKNAKNGIGA